MTMTGQDFTVYQGMDREIAFTMSGVDQATDIVAATWKGGTITKTLDSGLTAIDDDGVVKIVLTLLQADTETLPAYIYTHQLTATDVTTKRDMTATGIMTVMATL